MHTNRPPGRSRPTNNQLLYKAHFRWQHYTQEVAEGTDQPEGTEACASVTSAFLQVLATVHGVESARLRKPRNILQILSTNTRRTKVVELSTGTHRVADELRRHSLPDGEGGHYSTNLDRNRYGSDNNYLFTVTRYNLECLGLCPCLVDIEIVDTRNGNESQLVTAGPAACACDSPERAELADASHFAGSNPRAAPPSPQREMRRAVSAGNLHSMGGLRRVGSAQAMRRNPSSGRLYEYANGGQPAHSRGNSGGSDLFDALLMAATGEHEVRSQGEPPVSSRAGAALGSGQPAGRSRPVRAWQQHGSHGDLGDSLQNAVDAFRGEEEEGAGGRPGGTARARRMPRRNSVSMIVENPVLAQTGAPDSLIMGGYFPSYGTMAALAGAGMEGGADRDHSVHSGEGDTGDDEGDAAGGDPHGDPAAAFRQGLLRNYHKQSSAVNLARMGAPADARRLQETVKSLREEHRRMETELEEVRSGQKAAEAAAAAAQEEAAEVRTAGRRAADTIVRLKAQLAATGAGGGEEQDLEGLRTSDQEIELLRAELAEVKALLAKAVADKKDTDAKLRAAASAAAAAAAAMGSGAPRSAGLPPAGAFAMPYAMLPMFGMLPPYGGMHGGAAPNGSFRQPGAMPKVASMPAMHHNVISPVAERDAKRKADSPIPEDTEEGGSGSPAKRQAPGPGEEAATVVPDAVVPAPKEEPAAVMESLPLPHTGVHTPPSVTPGLPPLPPPAAAAAQ